MWSVSLQTSPSLPRAGHADAVSHIRRYGCRVDMKAEQLGR
jgi:hypothetical protein